MAFVIATVSLLVLAFAVLLAVYLVRQIDGGQTMPSTIQIYALRES